MQVSTIPARFQKVWAVNAAGAYIRTVPVDSQIGIQDGAASFDTGFVPDNFTPVAAGGVPPFGQDFNGLLNTMTAWQQWGQAGGPIPYDATFSAAVNGYPSGAVLASGILKGAQWYSTVDNNLTNPDDPLTSSGWLRVGLPAGALVPFLSAVPAGYVHARGDQTLGSGSSGANYAAADALFLFVANWSNSQLAIYTSGGVVTSRGANAVADFNANKRLAMPDGRGAGVIGVDAGGSTNLNGVPVVAGNTTTPGSTFGENVHALTLSETPTGITSSNPSQPITVVTGVNTFVPNQSANNDSFGPSGQPIRWNDGTAQAGVTSTGNNSISVTSNNTGGSSHNNVERSLGVNWGQRL